MGISSAFDTLFSWPRELFFPSPGWDKYRRLSTIHPYFRHILYDEVPAGRSNKLKWHLPLKKKKKSKCQTFRVRRKVGVKLYGIDKEDEIERFHLFTEKVLVFGYPGICS